MQELLERQRAEGIIPGVQPAAANLSATTESSSSTPAAETSSSAPSSSTNQTVPGAAAELAARAALSPSADGLTPGHFLPPASPSTCIALGAEDSSNTGQKPSDAAAFPSEYAPDSNAGEESQKSEDGPVEARLSRHQDGRVNLAAGLAAALEQGLGSLGSAPDVDSDLGLGMMNIDLNLNEGVNVPKLRLPPTSGAGAEGGDADADADVGMADELELMDEDEWLEKRAKGLRSLKHIDSLNLLHPLGAEPDGEQLSSDSEFDPPDAAAAAASEKAALDLDASTSSNPDSGSDSNGTNPDQHSKPIAIPGLSVSPSPSPAPPPSTPTDADAGHYAHKSGGTLPTSPSTEAAAFSRECLSPTPDELLLSSPLSSSPRTQAIKRFRFQVTFVLDETHEAETNRATSTTTSSSNPNSADSCPQSDQSTCSASASASEPAAATSLPEGPAPPPCAVPSHATVPLTIEPSSPDDVKSAEASSAFAADQPSTDSGLADPTESDSRQSSPAIQRPGSQLTSTEAAAAAAVSGSDSPPAPSSPPLDAGSFAGDLSSHDPSRLDTRIASFAEACVGANT